MTKRYRGGIVSAREVETTATLSSGVFSSSEAAQEKQAGTWPSPPGTSVQLTSGASGSTTPYVSAWPFSSLTGFGTRYAAPASNSGVVVTVSYPISISYSPQGNAVAYANSAVFTPQVWSWSGAVGWGTKYAAPDTSNTSAPNHATFSRTGKTIIMQCGTSGIFPTFAHTFDPVNGLGTGVNVGLSNGTSFYNLRTGPNANYLMTHYSSGSSPYHAVYPYSEDTLTVGTRLTQAYIPSTASYVFDLSEDGTLAVTSQGQAWSVDPNGYFGTKYTNLTGTLGNNIAIRISKNTNYIALALTNTPYISVITWLKTPGAVGWGTRLTAPATVGFSASQSVAFTPDEAAVLQNTSSISSQTPWIAAWSISPEGIGTRFAGPNSYNASASVSRPNTMAVSPN